MRAFTQRVWPFLLLFLLSMGAVSCQEDFAELTHRGVVTDLPNETESPNAPMTPDGDSPEAVEPGDDLSPNVGEDPETPDDPSDTPEAPDEPDAPWCVDVATADLIVEMGEAFSPDGWAQSELIVCETPVYRGVASAGMALEARVVLDSQTDGIKLVRYSAQDAFTGFLEPTVWVPVDDGEAVMAWIAPQTGEYVLGLVAADPADVSGSYRIDVTCLSDCEQGMTRYPIVLMHGMGGTDSYLGLLDYFFQVEDTMELAGFDIHVTVVDPLAHSLDRARQLVPQLEEIMATTGARRLNLIGHSQGGLDGRVLITDFDFADRIASFTSIATPHWGTPIADFVVGLVDSNKLTADLATQVGEFINGFFGDHEENIVEQMRELTVDYMTNQFNPMHPDDPQVAYYSWTGRTCPLVDIECQEEMGGEIINPLLIPMYWANVALGAEENDGLVTVESGQWGEFLGVLPTDHYDEVGQLLGETSPSFNHLEFYVAEGDRLFSEGF